MVPDNLKAAITKTSWDGHDPTVNITYRECAEHYGFLIAPCRPRTPKHKGKVEAGVNFLKTNFCGGREPTDLVQANEEVKKWCLTTAGQRKHGATRKQPLAVFEQIEKAQLKALPPSPYDLNIWKEVRLHRDCYIVFDNAFYSAPFRLIGQKLRVRAGATTLKVYSSNYELVATHSRASQAGERVTNQLHLPPHKLDGLNQNRESVVGEAAAIGPFTSQTIQMMLADVALDRLPSAARLVRLARQFGPHQLEAACERANHFGEADYRTVKAILKKGLEETEDPQFNPTEQPQVVERGSGPTGLTPLPPVGRVSAGAGAGNAGEFRYARSATELLGHLFGNGGVVTSAVGVVLGLLSGVMGMGGGRAWS